MRFKHALAVALILTVCAVPLTVSAGTAVDDVSTAPLAQETTTMSNGTMDDGMHDNMTTTTDGMHDNMSDGMHNGSDNMTTTHEMDDGTMTDNMSDGTTTDNMSDDGMNNDTRSDNATSGGESGGSGNSLPGFGVGVALVALVGGALYIARKR